MRRAACGVLEAGSLPVRPARTPRCPAASSQHRASTERASACGADRCHSLRRRACRAVPCRAVAPSSTRLIFLYEKEGPQIPILVAGQWRGPGPRIPIFVAVPERGPGGADGGADGGRRGGPAPCSGGLPRALAGGHGRAHVAHGWVGCAAHDRTANRPRRSFPPEHSRPHSTARCCESGQSSERAGSAGASRAHGMRAGRHLCC